MMRIAVSLLLIVGLAGCATVDRLRPGSFSQGLRAEKQSFDGIFFRASATHASEDRRDFTVKVRNAGRSIPGALEAGRFEAVKYCLGVFGASDMVWTVGPDQEVDAVVLDGGGDLNLSGRCTAR